MITEIINGKEVNCKLMISSGIIHYDNRINLGVQIFPDEEKLRVNFKKEPIYIEEKLSYSDQDEIDFYNSYWIEKETYNQILPAIEQIGCIEFKDDLLAYMQQAKGMLQPFIFPENSDVHYRDNIKLKDFFENLEDKKFKIINFKMTCEKDGVAKNYKIEYEWLIDRFRDHLIKWKKENDDYRSLIGEGLGLAFQGFNYKLQMKHQRYTIYKIVVDYFYINTEYKSIHDICKKTGVLFAALNDLPSEEYYNKKIKPNLKYNNYHEYLGDRVFKIISRPI